MDGIDLFPSVDGVWMFLIVDGHWSRLELPFLICINDSDHGWCVFIGVTYGTAFWNFGNRKQHNGPYKINLTKPRNKNFHRKIKLGMKVVPFNNYKNPMHQYRIWKLIWKCRREKITLQKFMLPIEPLTSG